MRRKTDKLLKKIARSSLGRRLNTALLVPLVLILCVSSVLDYRLAQRTSDSAYDEALAETVFDLESNIRSYRRIDQVDSTDESESMLRSKFPDQIFFSVRNSAGEVLDGDADVSNGVLPKGDGIAFSDGIYREVNVRIAAH
jgi:two-component system sensor histidine kinase TctE